MRSSLMIIPSKYVSCFQMIEKYRAVSRDILALPSIETFDMIRLDCEDLKRGLSDAAKDLANILLKRVTDDHRTENELYVSTSYVNC